MMAPAMLVLIRHGESEWNARGLTTGWADVPLTARGREQARAAGRVLAANGVRIDVVYTSMLHRAQQTTAAMLGAWGREAPSVRSLHALNERHVGQLQGLTKHQIRERWGNAQRQRWRSDVDALPPPLDLDDPRHPRHHAQFRAIPAQRLPASERVSDLRRRVLTAWRTHIVSDLEAGLDVVIVAHRDSLRVLIAELEAIDPGRFADIEVAPATPRSYAVCGKARITPRPFSRME